MIKHAVTFSFIFTLAEHFTNETKQMEESRPPTDFFNVHGTQQKHQSFLTTLCLKMLFEASQSVKRIEHRRSSGTTTAMPSDPRKNPSQRQIFCLNAD